MRFSPVFSQSMELWREIPEVESDLLFHVPVVIGVINLRTL